METKPYSLQAPEAIAKEYGGNKQAIARAAQTGLVDPTAAVLAGMFIDRMRNAATQEQTPQQTVAQQVFAPPALPAGLGATPQAQQMPQMPAAPMDAPMAPPMAPGMAGGGLADLPVDESMIPDEYAGGGIVAFASGGDTDDEDDDDETGFGDERLDRENESLAMRLIAANRANSAIGPLGTGITPYPSAGAANSKPEISLSSVKEDRSMGLKVPSGHKYESKIISEAERIGLDPQFALYLAAKETGGAKDPERAKSSAGALGVMQLMPGTAKDMGVKDPFDPDQNIAGGVRYAKMMLEKYQDPRLAAIAYNWGPGNTDKWLKSGADISKLPKETRNYVANLKAGGEVKHFDRGGLNLGDKPIWEDYTDVEPVLPRSKLVEQMTLQELQEFNRSGTIPKRLSGIVAGKQVGAPPLFGETTGPSAAFRAEEPKIAKDQIAAAPDLERSFKDTDTGVDLTDLIQNAAAAGVPSGAGGEGAGAKGPSLSEQLSDYLSKRESSIAKQKEQDKYMSLLAAGLGIMGGTSRHAAQNIGQGALQGIAYAQGAAKQRAAEENALLSGRLGQYRVAQNEELRRELSKQGQEGRLGQQIVAMENKILDAARNDVLKSGIILDSAEGQAAISRRVAELKASNPYLAKLYKDLGLPEITGGTPMTSALAKSAEERLKQYRYK